MYGIEVFNGFTALWLLVLKRGRQKPGFNPPFGVLRDAVLRARVMKRWGRKLREVSQATIPEEKAFRRQD